MELSISLDVLFDLAVCILVHVNLPLTLGLLGHSDDSTTSSLPEDSDTSGEDRSMET